MNPVNIFEFDELIMKTEEYEKAQLSDTTKANYRYHYKRFVLWCQKYNLEYMPCTSQTLAYYISSIGESHSMSTIEVILASVELAHRDNKLCIIGDRELYKKVKRGIKRMHPKLEKQVRAIRLDHLRAVCNHLNPRNEKDTRDRAILTLGFFAGLRRSEIVSLNMKDISFDDRGMQINLMRSKGSKEPVKIYLSHCVETGICPIQSVKALFVFLYEKLKSNDDALFRVVFTNERLSSKSVANTIKEKFGNEYSGHSLRRGLITSLSERGVNMNDIKKISRHRSLDSVSGYIEVVDGYAKSSGNYLSA